MAPKRFARANVADMDLDNRRLEREKSVEDGHRRVRVAGRVNDQPGRFLSARFLDPVDDLTFVVGLAKLEATPC